MKQYLQLLRDIKKNGTYKGSAREGMPGTTSLFGYQMRFDLSKGFPLVTTKKVNFNHIITELLWFLKGDTNIKYLVDNGCNIWNEDAYNYYLKKYKESRLPLLDTIPFDTFNHKIKEGSLNYEDRLGNYKLGDCGKQYGKLWRDWTGSFGFNKGNRTIDQIKDLIEGLKNNSMSRRHIVTAWNPSTLEDMALNACHAFVQFNCRPLSLDQRAKVLHDSNMKIESIQGSEDDFYDYHNIPKYYLDCQMYQRSADVFLGVPYNIASYALLTEILAKICNMVPGDFIHTFGDVHIYDNHKEQVDLQLTREERELPTLVFSSEFLNLTGNTNREDSTVEEQVEWLLQSIPQWGVDLFTLENYNPHPTIKAKLSTGLK